VFCKGIEAVWGLPPAEGKILLMVDCFTGADWILVGG
jgi:hypothetical protein